MNLWDAGLSLWCIWLMTEQPGYLNDNLSEDHTTGRLQSGIQSSSCVLQMHSGKCQQPRTQWHFLRYRSYLLRLKVCPSLQISHSQTAYVCVARDLSGNDPGLLPVWHTVHIRESGRENNCGTFLSDTKKMWVKGFGNRLAPGQRVTAVSASSFLFLSHSSSGFPLKLQHSHVS